MLWTTPEMSCFAPFKKFHILKRSRIFFRNFSFLTILECLLSGPFQNVYIQDIPKLIFFFFLNFHLSPSKGAMGLPKASQQMTNIKDTQVVLYIPDHSRTFTFWGPGGKGVRGVKNSPRIAKRIAKVKCFSNVFESLVVRMVNQSIS